MENIFNADEAIESLVKKTDSDFEREPALDDIVHDICSRMASDVNNGGAREQITFIITQLGPDGVKEVSEAL